MRPILNGILENTLTNGGEDPPQVGESLRDSSDALVSDGETGERVKVPKTN